MNGSPALPDPAEVAASLRAVVAAIDRGELAADEAQRAYLTGAAAALKALGVRGGPLSPVVGQRSKRQTTD